MKIILSESLKEAKKKKKKGTTYKGEHFSVNPWAVCHTTVDKEENPKKFEKCVKKVKNKTKTSETIVQNDGVKTLNVDGFLLSPKIAGQDIIVRFKDNSKEMANGFKYLGISILDVTLPNGKTYPKEKLSSDMIKNLQLDIFDNLTGNSYAETENSFEKFAEQWMQEAVSKPGSFRSYCKRKGYDSVTQECIEEGKKSTDPTTKHRANLAETFRKTKKKK